MSMYESAERINKDLNNLFGSEQMSDFTNWQREQILNILIRFGAVAKFRCRSNVAYKNFVSSCFKDIAEVKEEQLKADDDYKIIKAKIPALNQYVDWCKQNNKEDCRESFMEWARR